jgi:hypothetical protein
MLKILLLMLFLLSGCEDQKNSSDATLKVMTPIVPEKHKHQKLDEPAICAELSVSECLRIIIPAIWDREVERDCG